MGVKRKSTLEQKVAILHCYGENNGLPFECQIPNVSACSRKSLFLYPLTFIAVSDCVKVHVILLIGEEQKTEPGIKGIDGDYEEDPNDVPLFVWRAVVT